MSVNVKSGKRNILLVDIGAPFGGVETYLEALAHLLQGEYGLFCVCGLPELTRRLQAAGVHVVTIPILVTRWSKIVRFVAALFVVPYLVRRYRIDVVQVNGFLESLLMLPAKALGCKTVRASHGPTELGRYVWYKRPEMVLPRAAALFSLRYADRVVCVSNAVRDELLPVVPAERLRVVSNWVRRLPALPVLPGKEDAPAGPLRLLYVGRIERYKGVFLLLEAVRQVPGVHLTVVGHGSHEEEMKVAAKGLAVTFAGFHKDPTPFYEQADAFVNASMGPEGLPMANLEAMSFALPCIFSDLPVHCEISDAGRGAALFARGDATALVQCIQIFQQNASERSRVGRRGRDIIEQRYSEGAARQSYLEVFRF